MINTKFFEPRNIAIIGIASLVFTFLANKIFKSNEGAV